MAGGWGGVLACLMQGLSARTAHRRVLGETIRSHRKNSGITQEKLAEKAGLHHNFIGELERGNMETSVTSLLRIAKALRVTVAELVKDVR